MTTSGQCNANFPQLQQAVAQQSATARTMTCYLLSEDTCTVPTSNSCTKCVSSPVRIHDRTPDCHLISWAWMHGLPLQLKVALSRKLRESSMCFAYICDIISMGVSTTRHGQTSGRLVQELNVRTVGSRNHCVNGALRK